MCSDTEGWGTREELERWRRIRISVAAYAYEYENDSIMSDAAFDSLSLVIDTNLSTGNKKLDRFFQLNFAPETGMWIRKHPEKQKLRYLYNKYWKGKPKRKPLTDTLN